MSAILIMLGIFLASFLLSVATLWIAGKLLKFPASTLPRAVGVAAVIFFLQILMNAAVLASPTPWRLPGACLGLVIDLALAAYLIKRFCRTTTGRAAASTGFIILAQTCLVIVALTVVRPFLVEAFSISDEAMAPTIRGPHYVAICPHCGGELLVDAPDPRYRFQPPEEPAICAACLRHFQIPTASLTSPVSGSDHIFVTKFLTPRRWDIIAFHARHNVIYLKRLVGLPGETIAINDAGQISINGKPIGSPPDHPSLTFPWPKGFDLSRLPLTPTSSLRLGPDDYFTIGDNSQFSVDSRFFGAIHKADIVGVTTLIYWPPSRFKIIR